MRSSSRARERPSGVLLTALLFAGFFALYQLTFSLHPRAYPPPRSRTLYEHFGADNMVQVLREPRPGGELSIHLVKHPLFAVVMPPLHAFGKRVYFAWPERQRAQLAAAFPFAFLGAVNVCLALRLLLANIASLRIALPFALIFGLSASSWFFSSYPETYVLTSVCTNLFFTVLLKPAPLRRRMTVLAVLNALAAYAAPHQLMLAVVPCLRELQIERGSRQAWSEVARYGLLLFLLFVLPYQLWLRWADLSWTAYLEHVGAIGRLWEPRWGAVTLLNFFVFSVIGPVAEPRLYGDRSLAVLGRVSWPWLFGLAAYVACAGRGLWRARRSQAPWTAFAPGAAFLLSGYSLFFWCFNPRESFIYSLPILLPWLMLVHSGWGAGIGRRFEVALFVWIGCLVINNAQLMRLVGEL